MPICRFAFFSFKHRSIHVPNQLQRFGPCKRIQSCGYSKSAKNGYGKPTDRSVLNAETQPSRSWSTYVVPAAVLLGFAGFAAFLHYNDERRAVPLGWGNSSASVIGDGPVIGGPFTLVNTENKVVNEQDFAGNWVLLYFGYTLSPDLGPDQVQTMAKAVDTLESKENVKIVPLFVTIDPQRDNPAQLHTYLKEFDSRIVGLTGPVGAIRKMAQEYRVYFRKVHEEGDDYLIESSHSMYLLDPTMKVVRCFGLEYNAEEVLKGILKEVKKLQPNAH